MQHTCISFCQACPSPRCKFRNLHHFIVTYKHHDIILNKLASKPACRKLTWSFIHTCDQLSCRVRVLCPPEVTKDLDRITTPQQALQLIASHGSSDLGFLQFFNLHRTQPAVDLLVRSKQLAGTAAQLLGARKLRLYQVSVNVPTISHCDRLCRTIYPVI